MSNRSKSKPANHVRKKSALLIIDMINNLDFPEGESLRRSALPVARQIAKLKARFQRQDLPVIYVNDNFGQWSADWKTIFELCRQPNSRGCEIAEILKPSDRDFFILKPKHSGFHLTALEVLLENLHVKELVLTGMAGNICVLFTAHDAHMRGYRVTVPKDCVASNTKKQNREALSQLAEGLKLKTPLSNNIRLRTQ